MRKIVSIFRNDNLIVGLVTCLLGGCALTSYRGDEALTFPGYPSHKDFPEEFREEEPEFKGEFSIAFDVEQGDRYFQMLGASRANTFATTSYDVDKIPEIRPLNIRDLEVNKLSWISVTDDQLSSGLMKRRFGSAGILEKSSKNPWDKAHEIAKELHKRNSNNGFFLVEPEFVHTNISESVDETEASDEGPSENVVVTSERDQRFFTLTEKASPVWPVGTQVLWHKDINHTQLDIAIENIQKYLGNTKSRIKVAHLDTGYSIDDPLLSPNFNAGESIDLTAGNGCNPTIEYSNFKLSKASHGQKFLSVLSGGPFTYKETGEDSIKSGYFGGDPISTVVSYRIAKSSVVHISGKRMTAAINCAKESNIDVISLSAGGFPSISQRNAVNDAYENGVAIFAAAGNHFHIPILNWNLVGTSLVFPARYNRVIAVAGVTADGQSYGDSPSILGVFNISNSSFKSNIFDYMMRGNYGQDVKNDNHMVYGYTPNIATSDARHGLPLYKVNGSGTSAATPQAAAAASLWLNRYADQIPSDDMRSWKKTEAVYYALITAANDGRKELTEKKGDWQADKFGEGPIKAHSMLSISYNEIKNNLVKRKPAYIGFSFIFNVLRTANVYPDSAKLEIALTDMLATELEQLIYSNRVTNEYFDELQNEMTPGQPLDKALACRFLKQASNHLKTRFSSSLGNAISGSESQLCVQ